MSIASYTDLLTQIPNWLGRPGDTTRLTAANVADIISLADARIWVGSVHPQFPSPALRVSAMQVTSDPTTYLTTANVATLALPTTSMQITDIALNQSPFTDLDYVTPKTLRTDWVGSNTGRPKVYTVEGRLLRFGPTPDQAYGVILNHLARFDPLATTATNWLLTNYPGAYLYSALLESAAFIGLDDRMPTWAGLYSALITGLNDADQDIRFGGTALMMRGDSGNP